MGRGVVESEKLENVTEREQIEEVARRIVEREMEAANLGGKGEGKGEEKKQKVIKAEVNVETGGKSEESGERQKA